MLPCGNPWPLDDDAQLTEEEIALLTQPSHGTRTTVLGVPSLTDIDLRLARLEQSVAALGHYIHSAFANPECSCPDCDNKTFDAWDD
jgi:hypothetical protein